MFCNDIICFLFVPVGVAQSDAEVPGDGLQRGAGDVDQSSDDDEDMDGSPADDEDGHHHQDHPGDSTQVSVFFLKFLFFIFLSVRVKREKRFR